jgi:hypothetical protein
MAHDDRIQAEGGLVCQNCGFCDFHIFGTIGFRRTFDATSGAFGTYDLLHRLEASTRAECAMCGCDVTELFSQRQSFDATVGYLELANTG